MNRLQALLLSRAARATSAACVICGALLLVKRRWRQTERSDVEASSWFSSSQSHFTFIQPMAIGQRLVARWKSASGVADEGARENFSSHALRELAILTKDPRCCDDVLLQAGTVESLLELLLSSAGRLNHEVECLLAEIVANLSSIDQFRAMLKRHDMVHCLSVWSQRGDSARLSLCAAKIRHNLAEDSNLLQGNIYLLSDPVDEKTDRGVDVVFVNGINGSVFHTWRPRDVLVHSKPELDYQTCWPRDWLARDLGYARLFGVDVKVRAWAWNPASTNLRDERPLVPRATRLLADVERAGVGESGRPVVWVTHSMGGLLVKEMLRQAEAATSEMAAATRGVLFMSTPHRGTTSLRPLFYFPFRLALSLESRELTMNSAPLCCLDDWFRDFIARRGVRVLDIREQNPTRISAVHSVILVQSNGPELGEVVSVPCDHITISKPVDKSDLIYTTVRAFVDECANA